MRREIRTHSKRNISHITEYLCVGKRRRTQSCKSLIYTDWATSRFTVFSLFVSQSELNSLNCSFNKMEHLTIILWQLGTTTLTKTFPQRWFAKRENIEWPPCSLDLTPTDFFFYDVKNGVYERNHHKMDELKGFISDYLLKLLQISICAVLCVIVIWRDSRNVAKGKEEILATLTKSF